MPNQLAPDSCRFHFDTVHACRAFDVSEAGGESIADSEIRQINRELIGEDDFVGNKITTAYVDRRCRLSQCDRAAWCGIDRKMIVE